MKNTILLIFVLLILALTVMFTLQNAQVVTVHFIYWSAEASLSMILLITLAIGIFCAIIVLLPMVIKLQSNINKLTNINKSQSEEKEINNK